MCDLGAMCAHIGGEDEIDQAAIIVQQLLAFGIHLGPPFFVQFRPCFDKQFIEPRVLPESLVLC